MKQKRYVKNNKNSSGDEIANVNFLWRHRTSTGQRLRHWTHVL